MKLNGIPYNKKEKRDKHFTTLKIQNRLYLKMAKTVLACLCMEPFNLDVNSATIILNRFLCNFAGTICS